MKRLSLACLVLVLAAPAAGCGGSSAELPPEIPGPAKWDEATWDIDPWE